MRRDRLVPVTEARAKLNELLTEVVPETEVVLLRHGRPAGILIAPDRYDALIERIEDLEDANSILEARLNPGDRIPLEKVGDKLGLR